MTITLPLPADERMTSFERLMSVVTTFYRANPKNSPKQMDISRDEVKDLFQSLNSHQVKYILVGGMALAMHGYVRATQDLDLWVRVDADNKTKLIAALSENGVAGAEYLKNVPLLFGWSSVTVGKRGFTLDMGHALKAFNAVDFDACYERAIDATFDDVPFKVIHLNDLITEKLATGRPKDLGDVDELTKIKNELDNTDDSGGSTL
jgi:predicted nucleotidyltransferase